MIKSLYATNKKILLLSGMAAILVGYLAGVYTGLSPSLAEYILVACSLPALLIFMARPELGFLLLHFSNYLRLSDNLQAFYGAPHFIYPLTIALILIIVGRWVLTGYGPSGWILPVVLLAIYGLVACTGLFFAKDVQAVEEEFLGFVRGAAITIITVMMVQTKDTFRRLIWTLLMTGLILGSIAIFQYFTNTFDNNYLGLAQAKVQSIVDETESARIGGPFGDANQFAQILVFLTPIGFSLAITEKKIWKRGLAGLTAVVCALSIVLTYSRGGLLALVAAALAILIYHRPRLVVILLSIIMMVVIISNVPSKYTERMNTMVELVTGRMDPREETSIRVRTSAVIVGINMFSDHPLLGVGMRNFPVNYQDYSREIGLDPTGQEWSPHNLYLEVLSETGILGFLAFFAILTTMFMRIKKALRVFQNTEHHDITGMVAGIGAGLIGYFTAAIFLQNSYSRYFWALVGVAFALEQVANTVLNSKSDLHQKE